MSNRELPHGFELRRCTAGDVDAVADLHTRRSGPVDAADFRLVATDPCAGAGWTAAVFERATGRAVSSVMLLDETVRMVDVDLPAGQVELVVTDEAHEGRGFVRALMAWTTEESARRGHVVQPITGIPSFYRRFGYSYAIPIGSWRTLGTPPQPLDPAVTVREATLADIAALTALHKSEQRRRRLDAPLVGLLAVDHHAVG